MFDREILGDTEAKRGHMAETAKSSASKNPAREGVLWEGGQRVSQAFVRKRSAVINKY